MSADSPRTEAGKRLLEGMLKFAPDEDPAIPRVREGLRRDILAIEREAASPSPVPASGYRVAALTAINDITTYDARRREVAAMIEEADRQDEHPMGPDGLADALMEIALGWVRAALAASEPPTPEPDALNAALDSINHRVNRGIGEGSLAAARWRDALIDVGVMLDDLINDGVEGLATGSETTPEPASWREAGLGTGAVIREEPS